jgi:hypothetical protein
MRRLFADKAYDSSDLRSFLAAQGTEVVISPIPPSQPAMTPRNFFAGICLAVGVMDWLR